MGHVWLIGMMGTGKTTVGAIIAEEREMPLEDTDALVMERTGRTIPELFAESEATFRDAEAQVVASLATEDASIISTGGGAILRPEAVEAMRSSGSTVLLVADTATLEHRLAGDLTRPLLADGDALARVADERADAYAAAADLTIDTTGRTPNDIAAEVLAWLDT